MTRYIGRHEFPTLLKEIPDPPHGLYIRGNEDLLTSSAHFVCVVGARSHSEYGAHACRELILGLRGHTICIVSGLALGIDSIAHKTALEAGLPTIAIPGSGLNDNALYPASNRPLAHSIIEAGGTLVSEFPPDHKAYPYNFPQRNRIMAGMSHVVLVVEAEVKSGTLITAKYATEYNRDVCIVPGSIFSRTSEGPHLFWRLGATPVRTSKDILDVLGIQHTHAPENAQERTAHCTDEERAVLQTLSVPMSRDELMRILVRTLGKSVSEINTLLMMMEIRELIVERLGEIYPT